MNLKSIDEIVPLTPVHFFAFQWDCPFTKEGRLEKRHRLPDLSSFNIEKPFATLFLGWNEKGIYALIEVQGTFQEPLFPNFQDGDSVEFFFDTRDVKTSGYTTRFCHHFYFLPQAVEMEGETLQAAEVTRFRTEDAHELCNPSQLVIEAISERRHTMIKIFIPSECLYGYDPLQVEKIGFGYRINRVDKRRQHFSANSNDFSIENYPFLWASLKLIK